MSRKTSWATIVLPLVMVLAVPGVAMAQGEATPPIRTVVVAGAGQASAEPDEAVVRLGVNARAQTAKAAMRRAARSMEAVIEALQEAGVAEQDIKTVRLDLHQFRQRQEGEVVARGWQVNNQVQATVRDIEATSDAIDAAVAAGATDVNSVAFRASDASEAVARARIAAVEDAAVAADTLAGASGLEVVGVLRMVEGGASFPSAIRFRGDTAGGSEAYFSTPIEPGLVDISVSVTVEYEVG
jgi:uncharacterized protein YggE